MTAAAASAQQWQQQRQQATAAAIVVGRVDGRSMGSRDSAGDGFEPKHRQRRVEDASSSREKEMRSEIIIRMVRSELGEVKQSRKCELAKGAKYRRGRRREQRPKQLDGGLKCTW